MRYLFVVFLFLGFFLFLTVINAEFAYAVCTGFENNCTDCSCSSSGCSGTRVCYGKDNGQDCAVSESCNLPQNNNSCDCSGHVGNTTYNLVSCGAGSVCTGELGPNGSSRTCHYCVSPQILTGSPPQSATSLAPTYKTTATVEIPGAETPNVPPPQNGSFVSYCQGDNRWGNNCYLKGAGCGPTSLSMVLSAYGVGWIPPIQDLIKIPPETDLIFRQNGWRQCGDSPSLMTTALESQWLRDLGFETVSLTWNTPLDLIKAKTFIDNGYYIIGSTSIHIFVVDDVYPSENKIHMRDPATCASPEGIVKSNLLPWGGKGWYYAYAIKKVR